jgi:hypothetical protein
MIKASLRRDIPFFLARRPGGGITELRTHEQGLVGVH